MGDYRAHTLSRKRPLTEIPVLAGHRPRDPLPHREDLYDDIFSQG